MYTQRQDRFVSSIVIRVLIWSSFLYLELCSPFVRVIQPEEMWMYKYPRTQAYVSPLGLWIISMMVPLVVLTLDYSLSHNKTRYKNGLLCLSLLLGLNGLITTFLKLTTGRPRPDFYYRCFPNSDGTDMNKCKGKLHEVNEGRKSFPSGHASFSFCSMGFLTLYLSNKYQIFEENRGDALKVSLSFSPMLVALAVAVSRTCDYHHHWQDVTVGGLIGITLAYFCYNQYFFNKQAVARNHASHSNEKID